MPFLDIYYKTRWLEIDHRTVPVKRDPQDHRVQPYSFTESILKHLTEKNEEHIYTSKYFGTLEINYFAVIFFFIAYHEINHLLHSYLLIMYVS